jgi:hypothetical protein
MHWWRSKENDGTQMNADKKLIMFQVIARLPGDFLRISCFVFSPE